MFFLKYKLNQTKYLNKKLNLYQIHLELIKIKQVQGQKFRI